MYKTTENAGILRKGEFQKEETRTEWNDRHYGLAKRVGRIPIGLVSVAILSAATLTGWLLGGPVGIGTVICAFCAGPIMQLAFHTVRFDATGIRHQRLTESFSVFLHRADSN